MMREYAYKKIDAFTSGQSLGNPAACLYLEQGQQLSPEEMLAVAAAHKGFVSEVVYCESRPSGLFLTYYSSECEVAFCGHGTIACMYSLIKSTPSLLCQKEILVQTHQAGELTVYNHIPEQDAVFITAPQPEYLHTSVTKDMVAEKLGLKTDELLTDLPVELVSVGLKALIVPVASLSREVSLLPSLEVLKAFCVDNGIDTILPFSLETERNESIAHTRVFPPKFGYLEDPATGSGNSAFGYYMRKHGLWKGDSIAIEQGGTGIEYNTVRLMTLNDRVLFGGSATERISGVYYL